MCGPQAIKFPLPGCLPPSARYQMTTLASHFCSYVSLFLYIDLILLAKQMEYLRDGVPLSPSQKFWNLGSMMPAALSFKILLGFTMSFCPVAFTSLTQTSGTIFFWHLTERGGCGSERSLDNRPGPLCSLSYVNGLKHLKPMCFLSLWGPRTEPHDHFLPTGSGHLTRENKTSLNAPCVCQRRSPFPSCPSGKLRRDSAEDWQLETAALSYLCFPYLISGVSCLNPDICPAF